jgi:selenide,water dikinase
MVAPLAAAAGGDARVLVGPGTADDAGVFLLGETGLVATVDFITPVCDDPRRFGRVAAANSVSDVFAMGGKPLFALNVCCFPSGVPVGVLAEILAGGGDVLGACGAALLGGHTVRDDDLKYGLAVIGQADPRRLMTNAAAHPGDRLILTKPIGTGVLINAYRDGKLEAGGLEPALVEMERLNATAAELALAHGVRCATDVTGFGLAGHLLALARASGVGLRLEIDRVPLHEAFAGLVALGVSTGATRVNQRSADGSVTASRSLTATESEALYDPQTSGGLLLAASADRATALLDDLRGSGHGAAEIGEVRPGPPRIHVG